MEQDGPPNRIRHNNSRKHTGKDKQRLTRHGKGWTNLATQWVSHQRLKTRRPSKGGGDRTNVERSKRGNLEQPTTQGSERVLKFSHKLFLREINGKLRLLTNVIRTTFSFTVLRTRLFSFAPRTRSFQFSTQWHFHIPFCTMEHFRSAIWRSFDLRDRLILTNL